MSFSKFAVIFAGIVLLSFGGAVGINYWVDPYDLDVSPGRTEAPLKRETAGYGRLHKAYAILALQPSVIALGASRTEAAIRMDHPGWRDQLRDRYNASVTAANLREIWAFLQLAAAEDRLKQVLIGLEYYSFNVFAPDRPDFDRALMSGSRHGLLGHDQVKARYYLSFEGLMSSLKTIGDTSNVPHYLVDGSVNPSALKLAYRGLDGQGSAFLAVDKEALQLYYTPPPRHKFSLEDGNGESSIALFRKIVEFARAKGIDLRLYISPGHARNGEIIRLLGLEEGYESWQRQIVDVLAQEAKANKAMPFPLWDFSAPSEITTEQIPPDRLYGRRSRWFWETSHYRVEVGDLVLDRIFGTSAEGRELPPDFGVLLTRDNVLDHQLAARAARDRYRRDHASELADLYKLAQ